MSGFVRRRIDVTITLGEGQFGQTGMNTVKLQGRRVFATISKGGAPSQDIANVRIYGVPPAIMNSVTTLGIPGYQFRFNNTMTIEAGDDSNGMSVVYQGQIANAWQNLDGSPETFLNISGIGAKQLAMIPVAPVSYPVGASVATIMAGLATQNGLAFENSGVRGTLPATYLPGTALDQIASVAKAAGINYYIDSGAPVPMLAIWPQDGVRGGAIPLVDAAHGLVGYPQYNDNGMGFRCLFNASITLRMGAKLSFNSQIGGVGVQDGATDREIQQAGPNGFWYIMGPLIYELSAEEPGGPWFCDVLCSRIFGAG